MASKKKKRPVMTHLGLAARAGRTALSQRLTSLDLYPGQDAVLLAIGEEDGISLRDLAERLSVKPPTVTKTVARLMAQGLVEKRNSATDARQSHAHLTEKGTDLSVAVRNSRKAVERAALRGFSNKERKALRKLLDRVAGNLSGEAVDRSAADLDND